MQERVVGVWTRPDTYSGHSKINHYHIPCKMVCMVVNFSEERALGVLMNGRPMEDALQIFTYNYKGDMLNKFVHYDRKEANECVKSLLVRFSDFTRCFRGDYYGD